MIEYRDSPPGSIRMDDTKKGQIEVTVCPYGVVDEYKTRWMPGVFSRSLEHRTPPMVWAHNWVDPIGHMVDHSDSDKNLRAIYQLDNFEDVPRARQAYAQIRSKTIQDTSFGFKLVRDEPAEDGVFNQLEARLDEVSPVLLGAVPGAGITAVRNVPVADVIRLSRAMEDGELTLEQALAAVSSIASDETRSMHRHAKKEGGGIVAHSHQGVDGMHGHAGLMPAMNLKTRASKEPYGDVEYADPGYQSDKQKRYPIDTEEHARAAWAYINKAENASAYSSEDLAKVKAKIAAACKKFGIDVSRSAEDDETRIDGVAHDGSDGVGPSDVCPQCGQLGHAGAKYCHNCGAKMVRAESEDEIEAREARALLEEIAL